jgi:hypothetical protein
MTIQRTPTPSDTDQPSPTPRRRAALARLPQAIAAAPLLGLFTCTIRAAVHQQGTLGACGAIGFWVLVGAPGVQALADRARRSLPRSRRW